MSSVEFEEPQFHYRTIDISGAVTHNTPFLIKSGIVKDLKTANIIMLAFAIICFIGSFFIINHKTYFEAKKYKEDYTQEELKHMLPETIDSLPTKSS